MAGSKKIALTHAALIGGNAGMELEDDMTIIVEGERIQAVGRRLPVPYGYGEIDLDGRYVMPGLVNLHARLYESGFPGRKQRDIVKEARSLMRTRFGQAVAYNRCAAYARTELLSGVTTLRSPGSLGNVDLQIKKAIDTKSIMGPRLIVSNMEIVTVPGTAADRIACVAKNPGDCGQLTAKMVAGSADWVSLMVSMRHGGKAAPKELPQDRMVVSTKEKRLLPGRLTGSAEENELSPGQLVAAADVSGMIQSAVDVAHASGLRVSAECDSEEAVLTAVRHGISLISGCSSIISTPAILGSEAISLMSQRGAAYVCPVTPMVAELCVNGDISRADKARAFETVFSGLRAALDAGVSVGIGTDPGHPYATHYDMWREMEYFRRFAGISREDTMTMATIGNARILGLSAETGSIEAGKAADMIVTERSPLRDLEALRELYMVIHRGNVVMQPKPVKNSASEEALDKQLREMW